MRTTLIIAGIVGVLLLVLYFLWRRRAAGSDRPLTALVFLMSQPRMLSEEQVRAAIERAWDVQLGQEMSPQGDWLVEGGKVNPAMARPEAKNYLVSARGRMFLINSVSQPYMDQPEKFAESITDLRLRRAVGSHRAWNSVDLFGDPPAETEKAWVYAMLGKLLVEFAGDDCLALYCPELGRCNEYAPELLDTLKYGKPLSLFDEPTFAPVVEVGSDDPRMVAAVAEARQRWPEFVAAFGRRSEVAKESPFIVKARFAEGEDEEFMWVSVHSIAGDTLTGRLENAPASLRQVKEGDQVTVRVEDLNDWLCEINGQPVGGFTMKVMAEAMKK